MFVFIKPGWTYYGVKNPVMATDTNTTGKHAYLVALLCGGLMEDPNFHHEDFQVIYADSPECAKKSYEELNNCEFYHGDVIGCIDEPFNPETRDDLMAEYNATMQRLSTPAKPTYDVVLIEKPLDEGLTRNNINQILDMIKGDEVFPLEVISDHQGSAAMGFITIEASDKLDHLYDGISYFIRQILEDMEKEFPDNQYEYEELKIWLSR